MPRRWRWLMILVPALAVGMIELFSDSLLDVAFPLPLDTVLIVLVVLALSGAFSFVAFRNADTLTARLAAQNEELEARNATARALHRVSVAITALGEIDPILAAVVDNARELLRADVSVLLLSGADGRLALRAWSGPADAVRPGGGEGDDDALRFMNPAQAIGRLAAPLQRGGGTIGLLAVGCGSARTFGVDDVEALASLANQAAIAIENTRLQGRLRELAVIAERERIAREMHDGLAQVLGYVSTKSQAVDEYLATGRVEEARTQLGELSAAARSVYVDVREAILGLRSPIAPGAGLVAAVEEHARRFAEASKLAVVVTATPAARASVLSPEAEAQVFRIVQESLTNVRKHAEARRVALDLGLEAGCLRVRVSDDGRGFPAAGAGGARVGSPADWPRFGLQAMRERAAAIGATVEWTSRPDSGAVVTVSVPVAGAGGGVGAATRAGDAATAGTTVGASGAATASTPAAGATTAASGTAASSGTITAGRPAARMG